MAAMVLPHSALQGGQHAKWRNGDWNHVGVDLTIRDPWDFQPNDLFPMPACVAFAQKHTGSARALPRHADRWLRSPGDSIQHERIQLFDVSGAFASPYGARARQGATIMPRRLFFVNVDNATSPVQATDLATVMPERMGRSPWKDLQLPELDRMTIERDHIWEMHLGETIAPFVVLDPITVVLPMSHVTGELAKDSSGVDGIDPASLGRRMRRRWQLMNRIWEENKDENTEIDLLTEIDYGGKLTAQRLASRGSPYRVVYGAAGIPTAAVLASDAIIDVRLVWVPCNSKAEALYLASIINSDTLSDAVEPLMSQGGFGARDLVKHVWRLEIPEYSRESVNHRALAEAGKLAETQATGVLADIRVSRAANGRDTTWRVVRRELRAWLRDSEIGRRIDGLVADLLVVG